MKKYTLFGVCCLVSLFVTATVFAQQGPAGQSGPWVGFTGPGSPSQFGFGFTGPSQIVPVAQVQTFRHKSPVIIRGNVVQAIGGNLFTFRDSSGEIVLKIGNKEWQAFGFTISPSDTMEISGEFHRKNWWDQPQVHAKFMRKI